MTHINTPLNTNNLYSLRPAVLEDAYEIWSVMDTCFQALEHKEYFICDDLNYVKKILSGYGFGVAACDVNGNIIGNLLVKYPGLDEENLGYDVFTGSAKKNSYNTALTINTSNLTDGSWNLKNFNRNLSALCNKTSSIANHDVALTYENLNRVVHMDSASVHPNHRGHDLERQMIAFAETLLDTSKYRYSFATVAPQNTASLKSLERNGYQVMVTKEKYGSLLRCVMMKILI